MEKYFGTYIVYFDSEDKKDWLEFQAQNDECAMEIAELIAKDEGKKIAFIL